MNLRKKSRKVGTLHFRWKVSFFIAGVQAPASEWQKALVDFSIVTKLSRNKLYAVQYNGERRRQEV